MHSEETLIDALLALHKQLGIVLKEYEAAPGFNPQYPSHMYQHMKHMRACLGHQENLNND